MSVLSSRVMPVFGVIFLTAWSGTCGAGAPPSPRAAQPGPMNPPPVTMTAQQDRQNMLDQLKIPAETIRRGPSGWDPKAPDFQNIDEEKANPWPHLPEMMVTKNRKAVDAPETWWKVRRPEIVEYFDAEIYGRVPKEVPKVTWEVDRDGKAGFGFGKSNRGQPRKPDDWGALRAWAWGASRALDYLETDKDVDAKQVGISGLSRYGKAAIVAMAYEPRFAIGLIGSSGAGGAKLLRRNWGEQVENLCSSGGYHWMAGNFLKYAGPLAPCDLPVDAHELIALCAPRPTFISYGASTGPAAEGYWVDPKGSFMAAAAAGPAWKLLGKKDLGTSEMPAVGASLVEGELAWRMHSGGHTTGPNIETFVTWASRYIKAPPVKESAKLPAARVAAETVKPIARTDANSRKAHEQLLEKVKKGRIDLYFAGDSITRRWGATDYPAFLANWKENFHGWNAANFGWGGDTVQNVLWRVKNGELDGVKPKVIVVMAGTNNIGGRVRAGGEEAKVAEIADGVKAILDVCREKAPGAVIILMGLTPRNDNPAAKPIIERVNERLSKLADGKKVRFLNINDKLADKDGRLLDGMSPDRLHLSVKGYQVWADELKPVLAEVLGPPAKEDLAPPPTGDPSAAGKTTSPSKK